MLNAVIAAVEQYAMLPQGGTVIAAVSGGSDSMAMLDVLCRLRDRYGYSLRAAHVNHCLRGAAADADAAFVAAQCAQRSVPLETLTVDVAAEAQRQGIGIEECGRRVRYAFFESLDPTARIATAHHLDDRTETFLFHFARGASLRGLCSIPPVRGRVIRPLLMVTKAEILQYCAAHRIPYVTDATNTETDYTRNRIRLQAVPVLESVNPAFLQAAGRCMALLQEDEQLLQAQTEALLEAAARPGGWDAKLLASSPPPLCRRALVRIVQSRGLPCPEMETVARMVAMLPAGGRLTLPGGADFRVRHGLAEFVQPEAAPFMPVPLTEQAAAGGLRMRCDRIYKSEIINLQPIPKDTLEFRLDYDKICGKIFVRPRAPGDRMHLPGRGGKTLKKLFNELAVPPERRAFAVVLADEIGVLAVQGVGVDVRAAVTAETVQLLRVRFEKDCKD